MGAQLFLDGYYAPAVQEASKAVFEYIRQKTGLSSDGEALINKAFGEQSGKLRFSNLTNETERSEQIGFMEMLKGFFKGVRNPHAHTHGKQENMQMAFEYLVLASLFCRRVDDAVAATLLSAEED